MKFYKKVINLILGKEEIPHCVFNCTQLMYVSPIDVTYTLMNNISRYYFHIYLGTRVMKISIEGPENSSKYHEHFSNIRKLFINAIGNSYLALYKEDMMIGDTFVNIVTEE